MGMNRGTRMVTVAALVLLGGIGSLAYAGIFGDLFGTAPAEKAKAAGVEETTNSVQIPLKSLDSGKALFLSMSSEGKELHYFALRSPDGKYRSALDACDVCFRMNRGYRQEGDQMVCNNCGQKFPCDRIGEDKGGCNPHPLAHSIEGAHMVIRKADIVAGKDYLQRKRQ